MIKSKGFSIKYNHVKPTIEKQLWNEVEAGSVIGHIIKWEEEYPGNLILDENEEGMAHVDLRLVVGDSPDGVTHDIVKDPTYLITNWGIPVSFGS